MALKSSAVNKVRMWDEYNLKKTIETRKNLFIYDKYQENLVCF
jgi:hypothetical protein